MVVDCLSVEGFKIVSIILWNGNSIFLLKLSFELLVPSSSSIDMISISLLVISSGNDKDFLSGESPIFNSIYSGDINFLMLSLIFSYFSFRTLFSPFSLAISFLESFNSFTRNEFSCFNFSISLDAFTDGNIFCIDS